ncbi:SRPBCC family protein [Actinoplanes sp. TRM 88003]|uniref:SRPBCC family protein n=1 Tax=Paractinoplanes aksuensis TaxID=2939490 RepID=A0ABT1DUY3_9ACTN|nr:SRPBCC domain-containing protein [Actinoplanes aksuensis]MCO8273775.1 SRPBCC family protein [Actinoplanes aksuensis]
MTHVEADAELPIIWITREFQAAPGRLLRAHTDPDLFARWIGPDSLQTRIEHWDARTGGSFRYVSIRGGEEYAFYGSFHQIRPDRLVQTFTYEGDPEAVALNTLWFDDLGDGRTRLRTRSLVDSFETRDGWLRSGMEIGLRDGYDKLERMLSDEAG